MNRINCASFFDRDLSEAIELARQDAEVPLVFLHVPKTAGTSVQRDLNFAFPTGVHVPFDTSDAEWQEVLNQVQLQPPPILRGHLKFQHLAQLREINSAYRAVTYLRHPLERLVSFYLWQLSIHRSNPARFRYPGEFESYCKRRSRQSMVNSLVGPVDSSDEAIEKMIHQFWFVGLTEYYHLCQSVLFESLNEKYRLRIRKNITRSSDDDRDKITSTGLEIARAGMDVDFAVYNFFHRGWAKRVNDAVELLMQIKQAAGNKRKLAFAAESQTVNSDKQLRQAS